MRNLLPVVAGGLLTTAAPAQSNVDPANRYPWAENVGWLNWRDAGSPAAAQGVFIGETCLSGFIWAENVGWMNVGDGSPVDGAAYANAAGADFGVNRDPDTGELFGLAWGENIGWINFAGGAGATPPNPARLVSENGVCRLRGYAWGENIGWLNLDDAAHYVAAPGACDSGCSIASDLDSDGDVDISDLALLLGTFGLTGPDLDGDIDVDGDVDISDLAVLLSQFGLRCP